MDAYVAELESRVTELIDERKDLLADVESLERENAALRAWIEEKAPTDKQAQN